MGTPFRVMDAVRLVVDDVLHLLYESRLQLVNRDQLEKSVTSIAANVREAYGRRKGPERNQFFRYALGSSEETDEHLRPNFALNRIPANRYWRIHNRLVAIRKSLERLMQD